MDNLALGEVKVDYEEELMSCVDSFCMEYEPKYDVFAFEGQCDNSLHASILASLSSIPPSTHEVLSNVVIFLS